MSSYFQGRNSYKIDAKGRFPFPAHWFPPLDLKRDETLIAARGISPDAKFLELYGPAAWTERMALIERAFPQGALRDHFIRWYVSTAEKVELDTQNRIRIPRHLMEYAGIDKETVLLGCIDRIEVWAKDSLADREKMEPASFDQIYDILNRAKNTEPKG